ncbi:bifunctional UDP-N-acetylglucosamine diphosphorylase/glucosamine-1-phosphate N-acetyltransferase GlmU [Commensalibacter oyaizuii]|uniref:Bifunctional protein GlmU n=1 Tax=Commensalibacter oyaizuii TaxID=3043873 RepID=A0ABT6PZN4_9PROT|nr:bifunctional UDP-N-acetylglucosamine diphosphorylase/glucosamine-1-phosphate N-acetyltransferase GlmU [Commensalibacter sp. TBRC 16381]MDI2090321.1 bifunctional UDP-N-acetylglucosamine diphosphorylase/glucosamine-1-phosphate N-acetyltransferase GlmU [Commensalibacter sp. TBRC 16381]
MNKSTNIFQNSVAVILAAGMGTRMKSKQPKAMHPLAGKPMLRYLLDTVETVFDRVVVVVGPDMDELAQLASPHQVVVQQDRLGTAHAAMQAEPYFGDGTVTFLYADNPLITTDTLQRLLNCKQQDDVDMVLMAMDCIDPKSYGRVIEKGGWVHRIVETADATEAEKQIKLCNAGVMCASALMFKKWLHQIDNHNSKNEYYLVDAVSIAVDEGKHIKALRASEAELSGINSKSELAIAENIVQQRLRKQAMDNGVTMIAPETVFLSADTILDADILIYPHVVFGPKVRVYSGVEIRSFSHLEGCIVYQNATIGPYARIRPAAVVGNEAHVGNFVELKATTLGEGAKVNHLTYLGDSVVGRKTNIGAGTITCNYDGVNKHKTIIGEEAFIGSDSILVAPVEIGNKSLIAAGSVITENVPDNALAFGRARQVNKPEAAQIGRKK